MTNGLTRRTFLHRTGLTAAGTAGLNNLLHAAPAKLGANEQLRCALIGAGGMGSHNARWLIEAGAPCVAIADCDDSQAERTATTFADVGQSLKPDTGRDYREILDRKDVDFVVIGTPDHWHALPTIHACMAGKDVYVQKPISHNVREGRLMVEAARKYNRVVMVGLQQRVGEHYNEAKKYVDSGQLGKISLVRAWMCRRRPNAGHPPNGTPPTHVDFDRWLGPAPQREFNAKRFHTYWRYFWDYANGKMADWGVHMLDIVRWYMGVRGPRRVSSMGRKTIDDFYETPDVQLVTYDFPDFVCQWETRLDNSQPIENRLASGTSHGIALYGENGTLVITRNDWAVYPEPENKTITSPPKWSFPESVDPDPIMHKAHMRVLIDCVKNRKKGVPDIEDGHLSTVMCELATIAYKTLRAIQWDADKEQIVDDSKAAAMLSRQARKPYELPEL